MIELGFWLGLAIGCIAIVTAIWGWLFLRRDAAGVVAIGIAGAVVFAASQLSISISGQSGIAQVRDDDFDKLIAEAARLQNVVVELQKTNEEIAGALRKAEDDRQDLRAKLASAVTSKRDDNSVRVTPISPSHRSETSGSALPATPFTNPESSVVPIVPSSGSQAPIEGASNGSNGPSPFPIPACQGGTC